MEMLINKKYYMPNTDKINLKKFGFRNNGKLGGDCEYYYLRFPLLKYLKSTTVEGEIIVNSNDGSVELNAYSYGTNSYYHPFYQNEYNEVYALIMTDISKKFNKMFDKIGIKEVDK